MVVVVRSIRWTGSPPARDSRTMSRGRGRPWRRWRLVSDDRRGWTVLSRVVGRHSRGDVEPSMVDPDDIREAIVDILDNERMLTDDQIRALLILRDSRWIHELLSQRLHRRR